MKADAVICPQAVRLAGSGCCAVYQLRNETGEGTITMYDMFPGVTLAWLPASSPIDRLGWQCTFCDIRLNSNVFSSTKSAQAVSSLRKDIFASRRRFPCLPAFFQEKKRVFPEHLSH